MTAVTGQGRGIDVAARRTHFHARTEAANVNNEWHLWKSYTTANYFQSPALDYFAVRNACGVFDLCPMHKYRIRGADAGAFLDRLVTRNVGKLRVGRVGYAAWCDDAGKVLDDGTIFRLGDDDYRLCSYERHLAWLTAAAIGFDVEVRDETDAVAALAVQGPTSCAALSRLGLDDLGSLKPFGIRRYPFDASDLVVSRTGFTGDLGFELWIDPDHALELWDRLFEAGRQVGIRPIGGDALDLARIEAGFLQAGVDFVTAAQTVRPGRTRSPFELGLDWLVDFDKPHFNGRSALAAERERGSTWRLVRLDIEGNKPAKDAYLYSANRKQIGFVTSAAWSPVLKANVALGTVRRPHGNVGDTLFAEIYYRRELHWSRVMARCEVIDTPFFNPPRRVATPPADF